MELTQTRPVTRLVPAGWLLVASLPAYIAFVALSAAVLRPRVESTAAELTQDQLSDLGLPWVLLSVLWVLPPVLAAVALAMIARHLPQTRATQAVPKLAAASVVLAVAYVVVQVVGLSAQTPTWGESPWFSAGFVISLLIGWAGVHPATLLVLGALRAAGVARRTMLVVAVIYALYWAVELVTYLPALVGPGTMADAAVGLPPFLLGFFWAVVGGALLRTGVPSQT